MSERRAVVLGSASPARLKLLQRAGLDPKVVVSGVDESAVRAPSPSQLAHRLAVLKARTVAADLDGGELVIGCDSVVEFGGHAWGKPSDQAEAAERWRAMRGGIAVVFTGHCVIDTRAHAETSAIATAEVHFGLPDDEEVAAYVATGEPLGVAGSFTLDGLAAPFVDRIDGDPGTVTGISLPLLRRLLAKLGIRITDLWANPHSATRFSGG